MSKIELHTNTLAVLISGLYCVNHNTDAMAIPESIWIEIAEKLDYFLENWDYSKISFEDWVKNGLFIYPKGLLDSEDIKYMEENTLCWERLTGNVVLIVSMDIREING